MFSYGAMERVDDLAEQQYSVPAEEAERSETVERLRVENQALEQGETRLAAAKRINAVLASLTKTSSVQERPALARAVLQLLDEPTFKQAFDVDGGSCRVNAVGVLLAFGYPWALQLHPDDLAYYRQKTRAGTSSRRWLVAGAIALIAAGLGFLALEAKQPPQVEPLPPPITAPKRLQAVPVVVPAETQRRGSTH